jgi:hypothetical protein
MAVQGYVNISLRWPRIANPPLTDLCNILEKLRAIDAGNLSPALLPFRSSPHSFIRISSFRIDSRLTSLQSYTSKQSGTKTKLYH